MSLFLLITVSTGSAGNGRLFGRVTCGGQTVPHSVRRRGGSRQEVVWHPARAAPHRLTLLWSGTPISREPLLVDVQPPHHGQEVKLQSKILLISCLFFLYIMCQTTTPIIGIPCIEHQSNEINFCHIGCHDTTGLPLN